MGVLLSVAYDGRPFHGWAPQKGLRTISGELLAALRTIDPSIKEVRGTSRTDTGVHARDQRVAFDSDKPYALTAWTHGAQKRLPDEISIRRAWTVEDGYFPRGYVIAKSYRYSLVVDERRDPFLAGRAWRIVELADGDSFARMQAEAAQAVGTYDFAAFRGAADRREVTVRTLSRVEVSRDSDDPRMIFVDVRGSGFLYHMVRILVGALVDVGRGRLKPGAIARALESKDRRMLGITAPPDGLYLQRYEMKGIDDVEPT